jgi:phosphatidylinositol glycan class V
MLYLLSKSGFALIFETSRALQTLSRNPVPVPSSNSGSKPGLVPIPCPSDASEHRKQLFIGSVALSQVILSILALTSYHVQIITRLASGYPMWYLWLARLLREGGSEGKGTGKAVVMYMVMYGMIQGVLFASFLPPA